MKLYLLDASVLIDAQEKWFPFKEKPEFWDWLITQAKSGLVKVPLNIYHEIRFDPLYGWINREEVFSNLVINKPVNRTELNKVFNLYATNLSEPEKFKVYNDASLIAEANFRNKIGRESVVVTNEISNSGKKRSNQKIPDICNNLKIKWMNDENFYKELEYI